MQATTDTCENSAQSPPGMAATLSHAGWLRAHHRLQLSSVAACASWRPVYCQSHAAHSPMQQQPDKVPGDQRLPNVVLEGGLPPQAHGGLGNPVIPNLFFESRVLMPNLVSGRHPQRHPITCRFSPPAASRAAPTCSSSLLQRMHPWPAPDIIITHCLPGCLPDDNSRRSSGYSCRSPDYRPRSQRLPNATRDC